MSCEYASAKDNKCNLTGKTCPVDNDVDKTAYRHCSRREWKNKLDDRHSFLLQRPDGRPFGIAPKSSGLPLRLPGDTVP
jgi:hypothetical protein